MPLKTREGYFWHSQTIECAEIPKTFLFETGTYQCAHCSVTVLKNLERGVENGGRERAWCALCDRYICDPCGYARSQGQPCVPKEQRALLAIKHADLGLPFMDRGPMGELLFPLELLDKDKIF
jgi:hypothetical protein